MKNEIKRNSIKGIYNAKIADKLYYNRRKSNNNKLTRSTKKLILALLKKKISPELICSRLKHEGIVKICFKAIYNFIERYKLKHLLFFKGRWYKYKKES